MFVGRQKEIILFMDALHCPKGQAILVIGQEGMGKSVLINRISDIAKEHSELNCSFVKYEIVETDTVDSIMSQIMDNLFHAANISPGSFSGTPERTRQWRAILNLFHKLGDLIFSLIYHQEESIREKLVKRMELLSKQIKANQRLVIVIDPSKYMQPNSDQAWSLLVNSMPEKIKIIFAQRPEDVLASSSQFKELDQVVRIPEKNLEELDENAVEELIELRAHETLYSSSYLKDLLSRYKGHPYALQAALELLADKTKAEDLYGEPNKIAESQWNRIKEKGPDTINVFQAYSVMQTYVSNEVISYVAGIEPILLKHIISDRYVNGLLIEREYESQIYHAILKDHILNQIEQSDLIKYHTKAIEIYTMDDISLDKSVKGVSYHLSAMPSLAFDNRNIILDWIESKGHALAFHYFYRTWLTVIGDKEFIRNGMRLWLRLHRRKAISSFVYQSWLDAQGDLEFVRSDIRAWLDKQRTRPAAEFVYQSWLNAQGDLEFVRSDIRAWLGQYRASPEARFVYQPWMNAQGDLEFVRSDIRAWLDQYGMIPEAQFVYNSWMNAQGDLEFVRSDIRAWFDQYRTSPEAHFLYQSWLNAGGEDFLNYD